MEISIKKNKLRVSWIEISQGRHGAELEGLYKRKEEGGVSAVEIFNNVIYHRYEGEERLGAVLQKELSERFKQTK